MAHVHFKLPDELMRDAKEAGISIRQITEEAIREALAGRRIEPPEVMLPVYEGREVDDGDRYQVGVATGRRWIDTVARVEEIAAIAALRSARWRDFGLDTSTHSLGGMLVEEGELDPTTEGKAWLNRDPFTEGIIDAVASSGIA